MRTNISVTTGIRAAARSDARVSNEAANDETAVTAADGLTVWLRSVATRSVVTSICSAALSVAWVRSATREETAVIAAAARSDARDSNAAAAEEVAGTADCADLVLRYRLAWSPEEAPAVAETSYRLPVLVSSSSSVTGSPRKHRYRACRRPRRATWGRGSSRGSDVLNGETPCESVRHGVIVGYLRVADRRFYLRLEHRAARGSRCPHVCHALIRGL